jgi:hypothetical protein
MKFTAIERKAVLHALENKLGVVLTHNRESVGWLWVDGKKIVRFSLPGAHGGRSELTVGAALKLLHDSKLSRGDFIDLVDCPLSLDGYVEKLRADGHLA